MLKFRVYPGLRYSIHCCCCSIAQWCPTLQSCGLQHARLPCPSLSPRVCSNSYHWVGDVIQSSHPLSPPSPPALSLSQHQGFSNELALRIKWAKCWSLKLNISPSNEYSGLISFRVGWLDLLALQGLWRVLFSTRIQKHQFFGAQLSLWSNSHICTWLLEKP